MGRFIKMVHARLNEMAAIDFRSINLRQKFDEFNARFFNSELPSTVVLRWTSSKRNFSGRTVARVKRGPLAILGLSPDSHIYGGEGIPVELVGSITIQMNTKLLYEEELFDLFFLHEMVHAWLVSKGRDAGHGQAFQAKANEVGRAYGKPIPLKHEVSGTESINAPTKTVGVMVWGPPSRRGFTLFSWKAAREFLTECHNHYYPFPIEIYKTVTNLGAIHPVLNKFPRLLKGSAVVDKKGNVITFPQSDLVVRIEPRNIHDGGSVNDIRQKVEDLLKLKENLIAESRWPAARYWVHKKTGDVKYIHDGFSHLEDYPIKQQVSRLGVPINKGFKAAYDAGWVRAFYNPGKKEFGFSFSSALSEQDVIDLASDILKYTGTRKTATYTAYVDSGSSKQIDTKSLTGDFTDAVLPPEEMIDLVRSKRYEITI